MESEPRPHEAHSAVILQDCLSLYGAQKLQFNVSIIHITGNSHLLYLTAHSYCQQKKT